MKPLRVPNCEKSILKMVHDETGRHIVITPQQLIAVKVIASGGSYQEAASQAETSKTTVARWMKREDFIEELERARKRLLEEFREESDSYRQALMKASKRSPEIIDMLCEIALDPDNRNADKIKASALLLSQIEKLIQFQQSEISFPEELSAAQRHSQQLEARLTSELEASPDWRQTYNGYWTDDSREICGKLRIYSVQMAYEKLTNSVTFYERQ